MLFPVSLLLFYNVEKKTNLKNYFNLDINISHFYNVTITVNFRS